MPITVATSSRHRSFLRHYYYFHCYLYHAIDVELRLVYAIGRYSAIETLIRHYYYYAISHWYAIIIFSSLIRITLSCITPLILSLFLFTLNTSHFYTLLITDWQYISTFIIFSFFIIDAITFSILICWCRPLFTLPLLIASFAIAIHNIDYCIVLGHFRHWLSFPIISLYLPFMVTPISVIDWTAGFQYHHWVIFYCCHFRHFCAGTSLIHYYGHRLIG